MCFFWKLATTRLKYRTFHCWRRTCNSASSTGSTRPSRRALLAWVSIAALPAKAETEALKWKQSTGMTNNRCNWPRGKVIGGSSVLNYMLYIRGNKKDYDIWESLGNPGWGYRDILYYFKKSEDNKNPYLLRTPYHASGG